VRAARRRRANRRSAARRPGKLYACNTPTRRDCGGARGRRQVRSGPLVTGQGCSSKAWAKRYSALLLAFTFSAST
jgi:hypothetical protein